MEYNFRLLCSRFCCCRLMFLSPQVHKCTTLIISYQVVCPNIPNVCYMYHILMNSNHFGVKMLIFWDDTLISVDVFQLVEKWHVPLCSTYEEKKSWCQSFVCYLLYMCMYMLVIFILLIFPTKCCIELFLSIYPSIYTLALCESELICKRKSITTLSKTKQTRGLTFQVITKLLWVIIRPRYTEHCQIL